MDSTRRNDTSSNSSGQMQDIINHEDLEAHLLKGKKSVKTSASHGMRECNNLLLGPEHQKRYLSSPPSVSVPIGDSSALHIVGTNDNHHKTYGVSKNLQFATPTSRSSRQASAHKRNAHNRRADAAISRSSYDAALIPDSSRQTRDNERIASNNPPSSFQDTQDSRSPYLNGRNNCASASGSAHDQAMNSPMYRKGKNKFTPSKPKNVNPNGNCAASSVGPGAFRVKSSPHELVKTPNSHASNTPRSMDRSAEFSRRKPTFYDEHISEIDAIRGLESRRYFKGKIRVNARNFNAAFVVADDGSFPYDIYIEGLKDRNRSFTGDEVVLELFPQENWGDLSSSRIGPDLSDDTELEDTFAAFGFDDPLEEEEWHESRIIASRHATEAAEQLALDMEAEARLWKPLPQLAGGGCANYEIDTINDEEKLCELGKIAKNLQKQPRGRVVYIWKQRSRECCTGFISPLSPLIDGPDGSLELPPSDRNMIFRPQDSRMPNMLVPIRIIPKNLLSHLAAFKTLLFAAHPESHWPTNSKMLLVKQLWPIGRAGEIEVETKALLRQNNVDHGDFSPNLLASLSNFLQRNQDSSNEWKIPDEEISARRDYRNARIFTIDPSSARDLDDALHITKLTNDIYEVGVHIADVSYFVESGSELDKEALRRATTVYLVQRSIPMLPPVLCEHLCSLNPGVDRLTFSAVWQMNTDGTLVDDHEPWFGRTIIRSCCKLDYDTAQRIIDGSIFIPDLLVGLVSEKDWEINRRPTGGHSVYNVANDILSLNNIATKRRGLRFSASGGGAISMNRNKLCFNITALSTGKPMPREWIDESELQLSMYTYPIKDSNRLIEEYMLLANYLVARRMIQAMPDTEPAAIKTSELQSFNRETNNLTQIFAAESQSGKILQVVDTNIDIFNGSAISSLLKISRNPEKDDNVLTEDLKQVEVHFSALLRRHVSPSSTQLHKVVDSLKKCGLHFDGSSSAAIHASMQKIALAEQPGSLIPQVLDNLIAGPMKPAQYISASKYHPNSWRHFALNIGCYTHFTSPIRRYADLMVHRILGEILNEKQPSYSDKAIEEVAAHCNEKRSEAKAAQDRCDVVFLCAYLKRANPPREPEKGVVLSFGQNGFTVFVPGLSVTSRLCLEDIGRAGEFKCESKIDTEQQILQITKVGQSKNFIPYNENVDGYNPALASQSWRHIDVKFLLEVWVICSAKETVPVDVQVDFLGPV